MIDRIQLFWTSKNILDIDNCVIVNAANDKLRKGGGVCGAIHAAAGPELELACNAIIKRRRKSIPVGSAVLTHGGECKSPFVIHAVGPIFKEHSPSEADCFLSMAYVNSMRLRVENLDIAFPAISCGIYGFPIDRACNVAVTTLRAWLYLNPYFYNKIILTAFDPKVAAEYQKISIAELK